MPEESANSCTVTVQERDEDLMLLAARDRMDAFETLVRRHQEPLVNFFRRMGVYNDAEDLAQETFVRLFASRTRYRPTARFTTFLYCVARRICTDFFRRQQREKKGAEMLTQHAAIISDYNKTPSDLTLRAVEAIETLPEKMRTVVVLNMYQGLKYDEIADAMGIPLGTVKSRMFNALRLLKEAIDREK